MLDDSALPFRSNLPVLPPIDERAQERLRIALQQRQTADFYFLIDVVGTCNLRCPSCPVGNYTAPTAKGLMSHDYFVSLLDKAELEHQGKRLFIDLYNWGEPALHPDLSKLIKEVKRRGHGCGISCNLNVFPDMREVVKAEPDYIRISLSGYTNEIYQQTHRNGDVNRVKANMHMLRFHLDSYRSETIVQVGFHVYRTNFPGDFLSMRRLCDELGFIFAPVIAALMPVEKAVKAVDDRIEMADKPVLDKMVLSMKQWAESLSPYREAHTDCQYRSIRTTINFDGSVPLCCATYERDKLIADDFLSVPHQILQQRKYEHEFCGDCMTRNLDMMYTAVPSPAMETEAADVLGPIWQAFMESWNRPLVVRVPWEGQEFDVQAACDRAAALKAAGDTRASGELYAAICETVPNHAEAHFQRGWLVAPDDVDAALALFAMARRLDPNHEPYRTADAQLLALQQSNVIDNLAPGNGTAAVDVQESCDKASAALAAGHWDQAQALYRSVCEAAPRHAEARFQLASLVATSDRDEARRLLKEALALEPGHALYRDTLAGFDAPVPPVPGMLQRVLRRLSG